MMPTAGAPSRVTDLQQREDHRRRGAVARVLGCRQRRATGNNDRAVAIGPQFFAGEVARFEAGADGVLRRDSRATPRAPIKRTARHRAPRVRPADRRSPLSKTIEPLRGVHDVLPAQIAAWQHLERITRQVFASYGYEEFGCP